MKKLYVFMLSVIAVLAANAEPVSRSEALQKARQFMPGKQFNANQASSRSKRVMADKEPFYIFNAEEGGFVVISGDDRTVPVIGYSEKGQLLQDDMPDNLRNWLDGYAEQLQAIENGEATPALPRSAKVTRGVSAKPAIAPLIQTQWDQSEPYSLMVPTYTYTNNNNEEVTVRCVTGCVATALAQVMNYYQWPASCPALEGYTTSTLELNVEALPATTFDWSLMKNSYVYSETGAAANEVAKLMRYIGQAIHMNYNIAENGGSGAYIDQDVMINTFGYSRNMHTVSRDEYTTAEWEGMIYQELDAGRPVLYEGSSNTGSGHQFICDGYDGNGLFHMNWGWGGSYDSYFVLSLANPHGTGIGGGTGKSGYIFGQTALIGFQPGSVNEPEIPVITSNVDGFSDATYSRSSGDEDFVSISTGSCKIYASYSYVPTNTYNIEAAWALWQNDQVLGIVSNISNKTINNTQLSAGWSSIRYSPSPVSFGAGLPDGDYRLVQVWRPQGSEGDWTVMSSMNSLRVNIAGNDLTIRKPTTSNVTCTVNTVDTGGKLVKGEPTSITVNLTNTSDASQETLYFWVNYGSSWELCGKGIGFVESGETGDVEILYTPSRPGNYSAKITTDSEGNNEVWSSTITIYDLVEAVVDNITYRYVEGNDYADIVTAEASAFAGKPLVIHSTVTINGNTYNIRKIDYRAFYNVLMTSLTIEEGVESIETQAFIYCVNMTELSLPTTLKNIGTYAFFNCSNLTALTIPEGVESIGSYAFQFCRNLVNVTLPSTIQTIDEKAFGSIKLRSLISNMQHPFAINANVFEQVDLSKATLFVPVGSKAEYQAAPVWKDFGTIMQGEVKEIEIAGITYRYVTGEGIADIIASDKTVLNGTDLVIPGSITVDEKTYKLRKIEDSVFSGYIITSLIIQPGLEEIGSEAFYNCYMIQKLIIPEGVKTIGSGAFSCCFWLKELSLPSTLVSVGDKAFYDCKLTAVSTAIANPQAINPNVFQKRNTVNGVTVVEFTSATLFVPEGTKAKYEAANGWNQFATMMQGEVKETTIDGITYSYITGEGFADIIAADANKLDGYDLVIPGSITVGDKSYKLRKINNEVFLQFHFSSLTIESGVEEIGESAFWNCQIGGNLIIPEGVKTIGASAFQYLTRYKYGDLSQISLPYSLQSIGANAFGGYTSQNLTTVNCRAIRNPFAINANVFQDDNGTFTPAKLIIPKDKDGNVEASYRATGGWQQFFGGTNEIEELPGRCDANSDGSVSVTDIAVVVNSILSIENGGDFDGFGADANGDGGITVTDIGVIVDMILGTGGTNNARRMTRDDVEPQ